MNRILLLLLPLALLTLAVVAWIFVSDEPSAIGVDTQAGTPANGVAELADAPRAAELAPTRGGEETARRAERGRRDEGGTAAAAGEVVLRGRVELPKGAPEQTVEVFALSKSASWPGLAATLDRSIREAHRELHPPSFGDPQSREDEERDQDDEQRLHVLARVRAERDGTFSIRFASEGAHAHLLAVGDSVVTWRSVPVRLDGLRAGVVLTTEQAGSVEGRVTAADGASVDGTYLNLHAAQDGFTGMPTGERRISMYTRVGADGRFAFHAVPFETDYLLDAYPDVLATQRTRIPRPRLDEKVEVEVTLTGGTTVSGRVVDDAGKPVPAARVDGYLKGQMMGFDHRRVRSSTCDGEGTFTLTGLPAGEVALRAHAPGFLESKMTELELREGEKRADVELVLESGAKVAGRVTWPNGQPAAGAEVAVSFDRSKMLGLTAMRALRGPGGETKTDAEGKFTVRGLGAGPFGVHARAAREGTDAETPVEWHAYAELVAADTTDLVLELAEPESLAILVVDTAGAPVPVFTVHATRVVMGQITRAVEQRVERVEDEAGRYAFTDLRPGHWNVFVQADGHATSDLAETELPRTDAEGPLAFTLAKAASISGLVRTPLGSRATDAVVTVDAEKQGWISQLKGAPDHPSDRVAADGTFRLDGVKAGEVTLVASSRSFAKSDPHTVTIQEGESLEGIELTLREAGRIVGEVMTPDGDPAVGMQVQATNLETWDARREATDGEGRFAFDNVEPGKWQVQAFPAGLMEAFGESSEEDAIAEWLDDIKSQMVEVREGEETEVVLGRPLEDPVRVHGSVTHAGEPYSGAILSFFATGEVKEGQKITSVDKTGHYEIELERPGDYLVLVQKVTGGPGEQNTIERTAKIPDTEEHTLDFEVPIGRISGKVRTPDGDPAAGVRVSLRAEGGISSASLLGGQLLEATTEPDGTYDIQGLAPGSYSVAAGGMPIGGLLGGDAKYGRSVRHDLTVREGDWLRDVDFRLEAPGTLEVKVTDSLGQPVSGAVVFVRDAEGGLLDRLSFLSTGSGGTVSYSGLAPGTYTASARKDTSVSAESVRARVEEGETTHVDVALAEGCMLVVSIRDDENAGLVGEISVRDDDGHEWGGMLSLADFANLAGGEGFSFTEKKIGPVPPGRYRVTVTTRDGRQASRHVTVRGTADRQVVLWPKL